jgi:ribokinase
VVGSYAVGLTLRADRFPRPGETLLGRGFDKGPGGKGSNQAIAAARLGAGAGLVAAVGDDGFGREALDLYRRENVDARGVVKLPGAYTGVGFIFVNPAGENSIVLDPGANARLTADHVRAARDRLAASQVVAAVLEIGDEPVVEAARLARQVGARFVLNPAPARRLPDEIWPLVDVCTPNRVELRALVGASEEEAGDETELAEILIERGVGSVVVTLGEDGAVVVEADRVVEIPPVLVDVTDTTGAGDAFSAALAVMIGEGLDVVEGARFAAAAGALTTTRLGVVPALPTRADVELRLGG